MYTRPTTLNIAMLGTRQHRDKVKNILTSIIDATEVDSHQSAHLIDGIGASSRSKSHPMLGTYDVEASYNPHTGEIRTKKKRKKNLFERATITGGNLTGTGYEDAMKEINLIVEEMLKAGKKPLILNLFGFSRGGDTILRAANVLYALYGNAVEVNIFAIDPVPGSLRQKSRKACIVPPNVKEYRAILMEDEQRIDFEGQNRSYLVAQDPKKTSIEYLFLRGYHSFATQFFSNPVTTDEVSNDTAKIVWDAMYHFAMRHQMRFKGEKVPEYVVTGGKSGKRIYTTVAAKKINDSERLAAYTRMAISDREYLALAKKSIKSKTIIERIRVADRQFLERKFDYFLHGQNCFADREHMLLFKKQYPAFFDYFFQENIAKFSKKSIWTDLKKINNDPLMMQFLLERADIDATIDLAPGAPPPVLPNPPASVHLDANIFYEPQNEMRHIWEGVVEAVGAIIIDRDDSVSKNEAIELQQFLLNIITGEMTDDNKIKALKNALAHKALQLQHSGDGTFSYKLATIAGAHLQMEKNIAEQLIAKMDYYLSQSDDTFMLEQKKSIIVALRICMAELIAANLGNNIKQLNSILNIAIAAAGELRTSLFNTEEDDFEDMLRNIALSISSYTPIEHMTPEKAETQKKILRTIITPIMDRYYQNIHNSLAAARDQKLQYFTRSIVTLSVTVSQLLASRVNIHEIDKALNTCKTLHTRIQTFKEKLWEDDPVRHQTVAAALQKLTNMQTKLELVKKQHDAKTYSPRSILYFSQRSEVVSAPADQLDAEIANVLKQSALPAVNADGLSDAAPIKATEDFVHDKARVNFTDIETGIGMFTKTTTVKSVQLMRDNTFKSEIYYDNAQLSRFGTKGYMQWAIVEFNNFYHANPMTNKEMVIAGDFPEKFVRYTAALCIIMKLPYTNAVNDKYEPKADDIKEMREYINKHPHFSVNKQLNDLNFSLRQTHADVTAIPTTKMK